MNTVRLKQVLYWGTLLLLIVLALTWGLDRILPQQSYMAVVQCSQNMKTCTAPLNGVDKSATLVFDNGIHANKPMQVSFKLPKALADNVDSIQLTLQGKDHYMGVSSMELTQRPVQNQWRANILLPVSDNNTITWQLEVTMTQDDGHHRSVLFEFAVPPKEDKQVANSGTLAPQSYSLH
ncbi:hypothetical protein [Marinomonas spartinae]|uniref:hypothetical protein n=1 Tax=Marinomonas spartinae TaxID=1792290 RepID=UPI0018F1AF36|nr:hypothetical protein [Marinomonas spartinae]MBJ7555742.1 hypothetical protein [Marinomonas spartinae]